MKGDRTTAPWQTAAIVHHVLNRLAGYISRCRRSKGVGQRLKVNNCHEGRSFTGRLRSTSSLICVPIIIKSPLETTSETSQRTINKPAMLDTTGSCNMLQVAPHALAKHRFSDNRCETALASGRGSVPGSHRKGKLTPLFVRSAPKRATNYPMAVLRRFRISRFLVGALVCGAVLSLGFTYGRRAQVAISLKASHTITPSRLVEIVNSPEGRFAKVFRGVYYAGSDEAFDYIAIPLGTVTVQTFRAQRGAFVIQGRMPLTADERKWVNITATVPGTR